MSTRPRFFSSSVGTKILIAVTGLALFGFLITHLAGNLLVFVGPESFNTYSHRLVSNPLIYVAEAGLAALFILHIWKTVTNYFTNSAARPAKYVRREWAGHTSRKTWSSTTMIVTGLVTLGFLLLHLRTFKFGPYYESAEAGVRDLYRLVMEVFHKPGYVAFYVVCMVLLGMHLRHGVASAFQSLGLDLPRKPRLLPNLSLAVAILIAGGFALIPIVVFFAGGR